MDTIDISLLRLHNQQISKHKFSKAEEVVRHMGAMQAQDYLGALWAVGLRLNSSTQKTIEKALDEGKIIRTWPMRGTLHFIASEDARWMLNLMTPKILNSFNYRMKYHNATFDMYKKASKLFIKALEGRKQLTRAELYQVLDEGGIPSKNGLGLHITGRLALEQLICFGPRRDKKQTMVLFDEWVPKGLELTKEESLREIAIRYFASHGPAQIIDMAWWSGLLMKDIRLGIKLAGKKLDKFEVEGKTYFTSRNLPKTPQQTQAYLLPPFDEYIVGYKDRDAILEKIHAQHVNPGANGMLSAVIVIDGQVVGTWKRTIKNKEINIAIMPFTKFTKNERILIEEASNKYKKFLNIT